MRDTRGAVVFARKIIESEIFSKPDKWFKIWTFLLLTANYKDIGKFKRGEVFTSYLEICSYTKATRNEVDHCIRWLKDSKQIKTRKATRGLFINIVNYSVYQKLDNYKSEYRRQESGTFEESPLELGDTKSDIENTKIPIYSNIEIEKNKFKSDTESDIKAIEERNRGDTKSKKEKKDKVSKEEREETALIALAPTPAKNAIMFFKGVHDLRGKIESKEAETTKMFLQEIQVKYPGAEKNIIWREIQKFYLYWTELNGTGTKERWQKQDTFQVDRRLMNWFSKIKEFNVEQGPIKNKYQAGVVQKKKL